MRNKFIVQRSVNYPSAFKFPQDASYDADSCGIVIRRDVEANDVIDDVTQKITCKSNCSHNSYLNDSFVGLSASEILNDKRIHHLFRLAADSDNFLTFAERPLFSARIVQLLHEEWTKDKHSKKVKRNNDGITIVEDGSRLSLLRALSAFSKNVRKFPPEMESFILTEIVPSFDGDPLVASLLFGQIFSSLCINSRKEFRKSIMTNLQNVYTFGSSLHTKYQIVVDALTAILLRMHEYKSDQLCDESLFEEYVHWADKLLLMGMITEADNSTGSGLSILRLSAIDFFEAVCNLSLEQTGCVATPSPALFYRIILTSTAVCIDRMCSLLLNYKVLFEKLKKNNTKNKVVTLSAIQTER